MSYLCDLFFIFSLIFNAINQTHLFFIHFLEHLLLFLDDNLDEKVINFQRAKVQSLDFA